MDKKTGAQSQYFNALPKFIGETKPRIWKFIDGDRDTLRACKQASPNTLVVYRAFTGQEAYKDASAHPDAGQYGRDYARLVAQRLGSALPYVDFVEAENEQTVFNQVEAFRWNEFTIGFANECRLLGMRPCVGNFPEGHPEVYNPNTDYALDVRLWQNMATGLRATKAANGALGLHEYGCPTMQQDWSESKRLGYRCGRHRAVLAALPADLRDIPLIIGEAGIDWLIVGQQGGYAHAGGTIEAFVRQLAWYESICAPNVLGVAVFGFQMFAQTWDEYDVARDEHDRAEFAKFISGGAGIPPPPGGTVTPYKFPDALTAIGAVGEEGKPIANLPFYRITGATVRRGVSAFMVMTVIGKNGAPVIGVTVCNIFPDGKGEVQQTDGAGVVRFQFGPSSAFTTPGTGPFTVFITDTATKDDDTKLVIFGKKISDIIHSLGDFQGTHTEIYLQFVEQDTTSVGVPTIRTDDELRNLAYKIPPEPVSYLPTAAFSRKARELKLGMAVRTERRFIDGDGKRWGWQAFNGGILKAVEDKWDNIVMVEW